MGQVGRCPLDGTPCTKRTAVRARSFCLAQPAWPPEDVARRLMAVRLALGPDREVSALPGAEGDVRASFCRACQTVQSSAYGIADVSGRDPRVLVQLGMMVALGKPTIILARAGEEIDLGLPPDSTAAQVVPFTEYVDVIEPLRKAAEGLPPPAQPPSLLDEVAAVVPALARDLREAADDIEKRFRESAVAAGLGGIDPSAERKQLAPELGERLRELEAKLARLSRLGLPPDPASAVLLGSYLYNEGRYSEALAQFDRALQANPDDLVALANRGKTHTALGNPEQAVADYERSLQLLAGRLDVLRRGTDVSRPPVAEEEPRPAAPATPEEESATYERLGRYEQALNSFMRSLPAAPAPHAEAPAEERAEQAEYQQAVSAFHRALDVKPDDAETLYNLACLFSLWARADEALAHLERAIAGDEKLRARARADPDFANIRDGPRFRKLVGLE